MTDEANAGQSANGASAEPDGVSWLLKQIEETFGTITEEEWAEMDIPDDVAVNYRRYRDAVPAKPLSRPR